MRNSKSTKVAKVPARPITICFLKRILAGFLFLNIEKDIVFSIRAIRRLFEAYAFLAALARQLEHATLYK